VAIVLFAVVHLTRGGIGAVAAFLALAVVVATRQDAQMVSACSLVMESHRRNGGFPRIRRHGAVAREDNLGIAERMQGFT
jgi:hypothetical protein